MNVYHASAEVNQGCGCCFDTYDEIVIAKSKEAALEEIMEQYSHTETHHWDIELISLAEPGVYGFRDID